MREPQALACQTERGIVMGILNVRNALKTGFKAFQTDYKSMPRVKIVPDERIDVWMAMVLVMGIALGFILAVLSGA